MPSTNPGIHKIAVEEKTRPITEIIKLAKALPTGAFWLFSCLLFSLNDYFKLIKYINKEKYIGA